MHEYDLSPQETAECFPVPYTGPRCECGQPVTVYDTPCDGCQQLALELEAEGVWTVFLASLKYGTQKDLEAFDKKLAGWKYVGADLEHGENSKGIYINKANFLRFLAPGHHGHIVFGRQEDGSPLIAVLAGKDLNYPDWSATFTSGAPHEIILAAAHAVIHQN